KKIEHLNMPIILTLKASIYSKMRQYNIAIGLLQRCTKNFPEYFNGWNDLSVVLVLVGRWQEAYKALLKAADLEPENTLVYSNLVSLFIQLHSFSRALKTIKPLLDKADQHANIAIHACSLFSYLGSHDLALKYAKKALTIAPKQHQSITVKLFSGFYQPADSRSDHYVNARRWAKSIETRIQPSKEHINIDLAPLPKDHEIIRVGYLSADFRNHAGIYTTRKSLPAHNRDRFEVHCIYNNSLYDHETKQLQKHVDGWHDISKLNFIEACVKIRKLKLHVLIDLSVASHGSIPELIALRLAPIQATWMHFDTSGFKQMDYWFTHPYFNPLSMQPLSCEKLIYLQHASLPFDPPKAPFIKRKPKNHHKKEPIIFGSFNNLRKISDHCLRAWSKILEACPNSSIVVKNMILGDDETKVFFKERCSTVGIDSTRISFLKYEKTHVNLETYTKADIALDSFPYTGAITTLETLWMGTPVITLRTGRPSGMVSAAILNETGLSELVASNFYDYIEKAIKLANDYERLNDLHLNLRQMMLKSDYCDMKKVITSLETAIIESIHDKQTKTLD
ncbi:MAG: hypothetical protein AAF403_04660, partial [Pseudomonadota bacterium]